MSFGLTVFTFLHVVLSLVGICSGFAVLGGFLAAKRLDGWTALFLTSCVATSVTGFLFPAEHLLPSHVLGIITLLVSALAMVARYPRHLAGVWRKTYVISTMVALYLDVFVLIVQLFEKVPALQALAPTQSEPPFRLTQMILLALFVVLAIAAAFRFRPSLSFQPTDRRAKKVKL